MSSSDYHQSISQSNCDVEELRKALKNLIVNKDPKQYQNTVQKVVAAMTLGFDVSSLFSEMVMACATTDLVQKKMVYFYLCAHAESQPDLALLTISTLCKDASSSNPMVRGLALRSMFNLRLPELIVHMKDPLINAIKDRSSYVRKTAMIGCLKMHNISKETFNELGLQQLLTKLIFDTDSKVSLNAVLCLEEILAEDGGLTLDYPLVKHLLQCLNVLESWDQALIMSILSRYQPNKDTEIFEILNLIDSHLKNTNSAVVMAAARLFLNVAKGDIRQHVFRRLKIPILSIINSQPAEVAFTALEHIEFMIDHDPLLFTDSIQTLFVRKSDPLYVKKKRLIILTKLTTASNVDTIVAELRAYCLDRTSGLSLKAIQCLGQVARYHNQFNKTLPIFFELMELENAEIYSEVMITFKDLLLLSQSRSTVIVPDLQFYWDLLDGSPTGKSAAIWIVSQFHEDVKSAPYLLKQLIENVNKEDDLVIKHLLMASMQLFWSYPTMMQKVLGELIRYCVEESENVDVRDRALFYYRLLKMDVEMAQHIVTSRIESDPLEQGLQKRQPADFSYFNSLAMFLGNNAIKIPSNEKAGNMNSTKKLSETNAQCSGDMLLNKESTGPISPISVVAVADLLGGHIESQQKQVLALYDNVVLDSKQFEKEWMTIKESSSFNLQLSVYPTSDEIIPVLKSRNIHLMASGQQEQNQDCYFLYCKEVSQEVLALVQLIIDQKTNKSQVLIKCTNKDVLIEFTALFKNIFIGKWLAAD